MSLFVVIVIVVVVGPKWKNSAMSCLTLLSILGSSCPPTHGPNILIANSWQAPKCHHFEKRVFGIELLYTTKYNVACKFE